MKNLNITSLFLLGLIVLLGCEKKEASFEREENVKTEAEVNEPLPKV